jgi:hypothetical protein
VELSDEELSLPNQESRLQPSPPELPLETLRKCRRLRSHARSCGFAPGSSAGSRISDVPPTATMNAVIPLVIGSCVLGPLRKPSVSKHRGLPVRAIFVAPAGTAVH